MLSSSGSIQVSFAVFSRLRSSGVGSSDVFLSNGSSDTPDSWLLIIRLS